MSKIDSSGPHVFTENIVYVKKVIAQYVLHNTIYEKKIHLGINILQYLNIFWVCLLYAMHQGPGPGLAALSGLTQFILTTNLWVKFSYYLF